MQERVKQAFSAAATTEAAWNGFEAGIALTGLFPLAVLAAYEALGAAAAIGVGAYVYFHPEPEARHRPRLS